MVRVLTKRAVAGALGDAVAGITRRCLLGIIAPRAAHRGRGRETPGQGNSRPPRYYRSTKLTYRKLVNSLRKTVTEAERDESIAEAAQRVSLLERLRIVRHEAIHPPLDHSRTGAASRFLRCAPFCNRR